MEAFNALSRARVANETGPQPITFGEIKAYCDLKDIYDEESRSDLVFFLTEMDIIYLKRTHERIMKSREAEKQKAEREAERKRRNRRR